MDGNDGEREIEVPTANADAAAASRRRLLQLGAVGVAAVVTIRPALAQTQVSVLTCTIPVPDPGRAGGMIAADGRVVPAGTKGAFAAPSMPLKGEDVRRALRGGRPLPGASYEQSQAYLNYVRRLQMGQSGFTCFASLQMPGRR